MLKTGRKKDRLENGWSCVCLSVEPGISTAEDFAFRAVAKRGTTAVEGLPSLAVELAERFSDDVFAGAFLFGQGGDNVRDGLLDSCTLESELFEREEGVLHFA